MQGPGPSAESSRLAEILAELGGTEDLDLALISQFIADAGRGDPDLAEAIRACAIPHEVDEKIFAVLRGPQSEPEHDAWLLGRVKQAHFVRPRPHGRFTYHDSTRDALLRDWQSVQEKRERFAEINRRLATYFEESYDEVHQAERDLDDFAEVMKAARPERFQRLTSIIEAESTARLLEALYHHLLISLDDGISFLENTFLRLELADGLLACRSLVAVAKDFIERRPVSDQRPEHRAWIEFFETRLSAKLPPYDFALAEKRLLALVRGGGELPPVLHKWVLTDLALIYESELRIPEAIQARQELISKSVGLDPWNEPSDYYSLGTLYAQLHDYPPAQEQFRKAIELSEASAEVRQDIAVYGRIELAALHADLAEWERAFEFLTEALWLARTKQPDEVSIQARVAARFSVLLLPHEPRAAETAARESVAVMASLSAMASAQVTADFTQALIKKGQLARAKDWTAGLEAEVGDSWDDWNAQISLQWAKALSLSQAGQDAEACEHFTRIADRMRGRPEGKWSEAAALTYRAMSLLTLGRLDDAATDIVAAEQAWAGFSLPVHAAFAAIVSADVSRARGLSDEASAKLAKADLTVPRGIDADRADFDRVLARLEESLGQWPKAREAYDRARKVHEAQRTPPALAKTLVSLARVCAAQSDWAAARKYADQAAKVASELERAQSNTLTAGDQSAIEENTRGILRFAETADRTAKLDQAREHFRLAAEHAPANFWPQLNLAFALAEQHDWRGARAAMSRVLDRVPAVMRTAALYEHYVSYSVAYAQQLLAVDGLSAVIAVIDTALRRLTGPGLGQASARLRLVRYAVAALPEPAQAAGTIAQAARPAADPLDDLAVHGDPAEFGASAAAMIMGFIPGIEGYWTMADAVAELQSRMPPGSAERTALAATRQALDGYLTQRFGLADDLPAPADPQPLQVRIGLGLIPYVDPAQDDGYLLKTLIPALRARIKASAGVIIPSINFTDASALPEDGYEIAILGRVCDRGNLPLKAFFVPAAQVPSGLSGLGTGTHPLTGESGTWISEADDALAGVDPSHRISGPVFLTYLLEAAVRTRLRADYRLDDAATLVHDWAKAEGSTEPLAGLMADPANTRRLVVLVKELVRGSVPLTDWRRILEVVAAHGGISASLIDLALAVRTELRDQLPGNEEGRALIVIPAEYSELPGQSPHLIPLRYQLAGWLYGEWQKAGGPCTIVAPGEEMRAWLTRWLIPDRTLEILSASELTRTGD